MAERLFTVDEANALLPRVGRLVEQLQERENALRSRAGQPHLRALAGANGSPSSAAALVRAHEDYTELLAEVSELGVVIRDPASGLVDFPAERDGRRVFLCWRLGEERVAFWHDPDSGFAGRQPL